MEVPMGLSPKVKFSIAMFDHQKVFDVGAWPFIRWSLEDDSKSLRWSSDTAIKKQCRICHVTTGARSKAQAVVPLCPIYSPSFSKSLVGDGFRRLGLYLRSKHGAETETPKSQVLQLWHHHQIWSQSFFVQILGAHQLLAREKRAKNCCWNGWTKKLLRNLPCNSKVCNHGRSYHFDFL